MKDKDDFIRDITEHLDQSTDMLDSKTLDKIRAARLKAMEPDRAGFASWGFTLGGIAAAAIVVLIAVNIFTGSGGKQPSKPANVPEYVSSKSESGNSISSQTGGEEFLHAKNDDMAIDPHQLVLIDILSDDQDLDLFENIEFYTWVSENENTAG